MQHNTHNSCPILYIIIPCYNEQEVLHETARRLSEKLKSLIEKDIIDPSSRIVFVNDGSSDDTWKIIEELHDRDPWMLICRMILMPLMK